MKKTVDKLIKNGIDFAENQPLSAHCTFKTGGICRLAVFPDTVEKLCSAVSIFKENEVKFTAVGHGSNLLFTDAGYSGAIIFTGKLNSLEFGDGFVTCQSGVSMRRLAETAGIRNGYSGFEFIHGIPGSIGGGVFMNAGAYGGEFSQILIKSVYLDTSSGEIHTLNAEEHCFSYRKSIYQNHPEWVIVSADFVCKVGNPDEIKAKTDEYDAMRKEKQPLNLPSAGSVFKRSEGYIAAKIIDECGLKGLRVGGAEVSTLHAGFIVNADRASSSDILALIQMVKDKVYCATGVKLECEIRIVGD